MGFTTACLVNRVQLGRLYCICYMLVSMSVYDYQSKSVLHTDTKISPRRIVIMAAKAILATVEDQFVSLMTTKTSLDYEYC